MEKEDFITPEMEAIQKKYKFKTPESFLKFVLSHSVTLIEHMLKGDEVLIGKDGKYERYEIK